MGTPLVRGETICFASRAGEVLLTDPAGKRLWTHRLDGPCHASPVAAGGYLIVGCDAGHVHAFRASGGGGA